MFKIECELRLTFIPKRYKYLRPSRAVPVQLARGARLQDVLARPRIVRHERVRRLPDGGLELMLTYEECENLITYLNEAAKMAGKGELYQILQRVPPKTRAHKEKWKRRNEERLGLRPKLDWRRNQRRHRPGNN